MRVNQPVNRPSFISGGSRISEKGGPAFFFFFFFCFSAGKGGGDHFAKTKTNHRSVLTVQEFIKTYMYILRNIRERGGGLGVLPHKIFKKIGIKSCNSKHF